MSGGWAEEYDSAVALVTDATAELLALDPKHELLKFWIRSDGPVDPKAEKAIRTKMKNRFWDKPGPWQKQPGTIVSTVVMANYYLAIQKALKDRAGSPAVPVA